MLVDVHNVDEWGNVFTLIEPITLYWHGRELTVPSGFKSDGASVPRLFWRLVFPPEETMALRGAFFRDYIYRTHLKGWTREEADRMFYDVIVYDGVPKWRAWLAFVAVRYFGRYAWEFYASEDEA